MTNPDSNDIPISPDAIVYHLGPVSINATLVFTWLVMGLMVGVSWALIRRTVTVPKTGDKEFHLSRGQNLLEVLVVGIQEQIHEVTGQDPKRYLPFIGTLFLFIAVSNLLAVIPGFQPPTGSLSTTAALALCVFLAVPIYGISERGVTDYLRSYLQPTYFMLPFNIVGELSRTLALAVRLFGNVMSGTMVGGILLSIAPFFFPVLMHLLGLLTGLIQAYIFAVLALVYIASATRAHQERSEGEAHSDKGGIADG